MKRDGQPIRKAFLPLLLVAPIWVLRLYRAVDGIPQSGQAAAFDATASTTQPCSPFLDIAERQRDWIRQQFFSIQSVSHDSTLANVSSCAAPNMSQNLI
jgi:hypothetical protein